MSDTNANTTKTYTTEFLSHFRNLCGKGHETYLDTVELPFDETWFDAPSNEYDPGMAFAGMGLSISTYKNAQSNQFQYISKSLEAFELEDIDISTFYHRNEENIIDFENSINLCSFGIGHRKIQGKDGNQRDLVLAVVRGTSATVEWDSNADVADTVTNGDYDLAFHEGFKKTADVAYEEMCAYLDKHDLNKEGTVLWIVGHSRGATVVNVVAAMFDAGNSDVLVSQDGVGAQVPRQSHIRKGDIYAYTFSSSLTTQREDASSSHFDNIFNVMNPEDYIPRIPLRTWGYRRFGRDLYMPSIATSYVAYRKYHEAFTKQFLEWTRIDYQAFHGFAKTNKFQKNAYDISKSTAAMYMNDRFSHGGTLTFAQYFRTFTDIAGKSGIEITHDAETLGRYGGGSFEHFLAYFVQNQITAHEAPGAHQEEGYLAKLKNIYEMGIDIVGAGNICDTECFTIWGPADVTVYDEQHRTVAHIMKGKPDAALYDLPYSIAMFSDESVDQKSFWIPPDQHYEIEISPQDDTEFDISVSKQTCEGIVVESDYYEGISLERTNICKWDDIKPSTPTKHITHGSDLSCEVSVEFDGTQEDREKIEKYGVLSSVTETGASSNFSACQTVIADAMATRQNTWGDHVVVHAYHSKHLEFTGWYEPGASQPVSTDHSYVFKIKDNCELVAHFARK